MIYGDPIILGGGGSGGPTAQDAILLATVLAGSTVTATKSGVTVTPTLWVSAADSSLETALFVFTPAQFDSINPWTITATDGTNTASDTILITTNKEYELELAYNLYLFKNGVVLPGYEIVLVRDAQYSINLDGNLVLHLTSNDYGGVWFGTTIDVGEYHYAEVVAESSAHIYAMPIGIRTTTGTPTSENQNIFEHSVSVPTGVIDETKVYTLDLSNYTSPSNYYFGITLAGASSYSSYQYARIIIRSVILYK